MKSISSAIFPTLTVEGIESNCCSTMKKLMWIRSVTEDGATALTVASSKGQLEVVKILFEFGADIELSGLNSNTPVVCAAQEGHVDVVQLLLEKTTKVDGQASKNNKEALICAAERDQLETVKVLVENGANVDLVGQYGQPALKMAAREGFIKVVDLMLDNGAVIEHRGGGYISLICAAKSGQMEVVTCRKGVWMGFGVEEQKMYT